MSSFHIADQMTAQRLQSLQALSIKDRDTVMAAERHPITITSMSELRLVLKRAADEGETVLIDTGETLYELDVLAVSPGVHHRDESRDSLLSIFGILDEGDETDIARFKDQYIADAIAPDNE
jgi:hypothetical protein